MPRLECVSRQGDMGEGLKLELFREEDGDIIVSILPVNHKFGDAEIQFCVPGSGGGTSPRTFEALRALMEAMEQDERDRPQTKPP